jgi:hypothetical protein
MIIIFCDLFAPGSVSYKIPSENSMESSFIHESKIVLPRLNFHRSIIVVYPVGIGTWWDDERKHCSMAIPAENVLHSPKKDETMLCRVSSIPA